MLGRHFSPGKVSEKPASGNLEGGGRHCSSGGEGLGSPEPPQFLSLPCSLKREGPASNRQTVRQ